MVVPLGEVPRGDNDLRSKHLTPAQVRTMAHAHDVTLADDAPLPGVRHKPSWKEALARIAALEDRVKELEEGTTIKRPVATSGTRQPVEQVMHDAFLLPFVESTYTRPKTPARLPRVNKMPKAIPNEAAHQGKAPRMPIGWVSKTRLTTEHGKGETGIDKRTVDNYLGQIYGLTMDNIAHPGPFNLGNTNAEWAFDEEQQAWLLAVFKKYRESWAKKFIECDNPHCPCHTVSEDVALTPPPVFAADDRQPALDIADDV